MTDKVDIAIQRLKTASEMSLQVYEQPLIITDSGGKDSSVLVDLAIKAKRYHVSFSTATQQLMRPKR